MSRKSDLLNNIGEKLSNININIENIDLNALVELKEELLNTSDERHQSYTIHSMIDIFMITFFAVLSDCDEWIQIEMFARKHYDWFKKFLSLNAGIPKAVTFKRVMSVINPNEVEPILVNFLLKILKQYQNILNDKSKYSNEKDVYAMDGKKCNFSGRNSSKTGEIKSIQAMSIYSNNLGICLATEFIEEKTNEIPTGSKLLFLLNLENIIVTFDALNTQEKTIDTIVNQKGYYVAAVKSNQENTYEDLINYFEDEKILKQLKEENYCCNTEKNHSSIIKYEYYQVEDVMWLYNYKKWRNIKSIGCVKKTISNIITNKTTVETRYYISNLPCNIIEFSNAIRKEWSIENKLHWHLDLTFKEDNNKTFEKNAQKNLNIIKKFCLSILKLVKDIYGLSLKNIRKYLCMDFENEIEKIFTYLNPEKVKELVDSTNSQCL